MQGVPCWRSPATGLELQAKPSEIISERPLEKNCGSDVPARRRARDALSLTKPSDIRSLERQPHAKGGSAVMRQGSVCWSSRDMGDGVGSSPGGDEDSAEREPCEESEDDVPRPYGHGNDKEGGEN